MSKGFATVALVGNLTRDPELRTTPAGENCAKYLAKGRPVAVVGRLDQRSYEAQDGSKRSKVEIVAEQVVFLGGQQASAPGTRPSNTTPANDFKDIDFGGEDDIPF